MSAPTGNKFASKPDEEKSGATFNFRGPNGLKGQAVRISRQLNMKLTDFCLEAIEEKIEREKMKLENCE